MDRDSELELRKTSNLYKNQIAYKSNKFELSISSKYFEVIFLKIFNKDFH